MAAPEFSELPKANGKVAPAIWDESSQTWIVLRGNPNGSMKVGGNVNIDNLPAVQSVQDETVTAKVESLRQLVELQGQQTKNVADGAALTELQAMKGDIATTKQTQADILEKLNGTLNTSAQLTGSKVEEIYNHDFTIPQGTETYWVGKTPGTSIPIDKSEHSDLAIYIKNNGSISVTMWYFDVYADYTGDKALFHNTNTGEGRREIPAGSSLTITGSEFIGLKYGLSIGFPFYQNGGLTEDVSLSVIMTGVK